MRAAAAALAPGVDVGAAPQHSQNAGLLSFDVGLCQFSSYFFGLVRLCLLKRPGLFLQACW